MAVVANRVILRMPESGVLVPGASVASLLDTLAPAASAFQSGLTWRALTAGSVPASQDDLRAAMRAAAPWRTFLEVTSTFLGAMSQGNPDEAGLRLTRSALLDDWPAEVTAAEELLQLLRSHHRRPFATSHQGFLWLIAEALRHPWEHAGTELDLQRLERRIARLAMLAGDGFDADHVAEHAAPTRIAEVLFGIGQLNDGDDPALSHVRSLELYGEDLPLHFPPAAAAFERARGMSVRAWLETASTIRLTVMAGIGPGRLAAPLVDVGGNEIGRAVAESLARDAGAFRERFEQTDAIAEVRSLAFQPLRESPLLRVTADEYLVLHAGFLPDAMDSGIWFAINSALDRRDGPAFQKAFGFAFEDYVFRGLQRCAARAGGSVARVPESGELRCDFALRVGDDLVLLDAKRAALPATVFSGSPDIWARINSRVGHGFEQLFETAGALKRGMNAVAPGLDVPPGWTPSRVFGAIVHHRPMFVWFGDSYEIAEQVAPRAEWKERFAALPTMWSSSDLATLERGLATKPLRHVLDALASDSPFARVSLKEVFAGAPYPRDDYFVGRFAANLRREV
jgi:hypothetical protein